MKLLIITVKRRAVNIRISGVEKLWLHFTDVAIRSPNPGHKRFTEGTWPWQGPAHKGFVQVQLLRPNRASHLLRDEIPYLLQPSCQQYSNRSVMSNNLKRFRTQDGCDAMKGASHPNGQRNQASVHKFCIVQRNLASQFQVRDAVRPSCCHACTTDLKRKGMNASCRCEIRCQQVVLRYKS